MGLEPRVALEAPSPRAAPLAASSAEQAQRRDEAAGVVVLA